jgi:hypothetical protein
MLAAVATPDRVVRRFSYVDTDTTVEQRTCGMIAARMWLIVSSCGLVGRLSGG